MAQDDSPHRNETETERYDRNWHELLQEMRVMQTGVQLIAGFLLTLPFTQRFGDLDRFQEVLYLLLVLLAGLTTVFMLVPIAVHRRLFGQNVKKEIVATGHRIVAIALGLASLLIVGVIMLVFDVVVDRTAGLVAAGASLVVVASLLTLAPGRVTRG
jgi:hypothetical protein